MIAQCSFMFRMERLGFFIPDSLPGRVLKSTLAILSRYYTFLDRTTIVLKLN